MKNAKETDKKYKYTENAKTAERITELIGDTPSGTVAQDLGLSRQTISNFVNGRYKPVGDNLEKLADYFNVSTDYILGRTDVKSPNTSIIGVCEYLGLTEQAVNSLQEASKFHNKLSDFIENHLIKLISQIMILSENSATFLEYRATHPTIQSDEYEQIKIDAIRYRATLVFEEILDYYDMRIAKNEEYEKSKEQGQKIDDDFYKQHIKDVIKKAMKEENDNGTDRTKNK